MTESSGNSQERGLGSEHGQDPEGWEVDRQGFQDDHSGPVEGSGRAREVDVPPAELGVRSEQARQVGDEGLLPGLDEGSLKQQGYSVEQHSQEYHVGPLPSPETLDGYNQVVPGLAERIVKVMEASVYGEERRRDQAMTAAVRTSYIGQALAALLAVGLVVAAIVFFVRGDNVAGGMLLSIPTVLLVRTFWGGWRSDGGGDG